MQKSHIMIVAILLLGGCKETILQPQDPPQLQPPSEDEYLFWYQTVLHVPIGDYGDTLYWAGILGDVSNVGSRDIVGLKPGLGLYFTDSSNHQSRPDTFAIGSLGRDVYFYDEGLRWRTDTLKVDSILTHFVAIGFKPPRNATTISYRFGWFRGKEFIPQQQGVLSEGARVHSSGLSPTTSPRTISLKPFQSDNSDQFPAASSQ